MPSDELNHMRIKVLLMLVLVTLFPMSGCIGNTDVETSEGDDVILGESLDDWPTYYVPASSDLPTCDSSTLGRLYYVEDEVNFQACMSTGWEVVDIGGSNANVILNTPPVLSAKVWSTDGGDTMSRLVYDGDGTMSFALLLDWFAYDVDGTIASVGIDHDLDGTPDITLPSDSGAVSGTSTQLSDGNTVSGYFELPLEDGISITRITNWREYNDVDPLPCGLIVQKSFSVIAEDDSGAKTIIPIVTPIDINEGYRIADPFRAQSELYQALSIPQSDIDWLMGDSGSSCPAVPTFTVSDHSDTISASTGENIATITISDTADWSNWNSNIQWGSNWYVHANCVDANGDRTFIEGGATFNGVDADSPQDSDTITIVDNQWGNCDTTHTHVEVIIEISNSVDDLVILTPIQ